MISVEVGQSGPVVVGAGHPAGDRLDVVGPVLPRAPASVSQALLGGSQLPEGREAGDALLGEDAALEVGRRVGDVPSDFPAQLEGIAVPAGVRPIARESQHGPHPVRRAGGRRGHRFDVELVPFLALGDAHAQDRRFGQVQRSDLAPALQRAPDRAVEHGENLVGLSGTADADDHLGEAFGEVGQLPLVDRVRVGGVDAVPVHPVGQRAVDVVLRHGAVSLDVDGGGAFQEGHARPVLAQGRHDIGPGMRMGGMTEPRCSARSTVADELTEQ